MSRAAAALAILTAAFPPMGHGQGEKLLILQNADSLVGETINGEAVRELIGHVRFLHGNTHVSCDRALQYMASGTVTLSGDVVVTDDTLTMRSPRGIYHRDERRADAFDGVSLDDGRVRLTADIGRYYVDARRAFFQTRVVVVDTASTVTADSLLYYRDDKRSIAMGHVKIYNATDNVTITGGRLDHRAVTEFSRMTEHPVLVRIDTAGGGKPDTLVVRSMAMEAYRGTVRHMRAIDSVEIAQSELSSVAGLADYFTAGDSIVLRKSPVVWYQDTQVSGDSINVYMKQRKLSLVVVDGNSFAISRSDSLFPERFDQLTGDTMRLFFRDQKLERIEVGMHAISVYHLYEDSLGNGLNKTSGDRIMMEFADGKLRTIRVRGGVEGQYFPENMVKGREPEYAIPGFLWRPSRPRIRPGDLRGIGPVSGRQEATLPRRTTGKDRARR